MSRVILTIIIFLLCSCLKVEIGEEKEKTPDTKTEVQTSKLKGSISFNISFLPTVYAADEEICSAKATSDSYVKLVDALSEEELCRIDIKDNEYDFSGHVKDEDLEGLSLKLIVVSPDSPHDGKAKYVDPELEEQDIHAVSSYAADFIEEKRAQFDSHEKIMEFAEQYHEKKIEKFFRNMDDAIDDIDDIKLALEDNYKKEVVKHSSFKDQIVNYLEGSEIGDESEIEDEHFIHADNYQALSCLFDQSQNNCGADAPPAGMIPQAPAYVQCTRDDGIIGLMPNPDLMGQIAGAEQVEPECTGVYIPALRTFDSNCREFFKYSNAFVKICTCEFDQSGMNCNQEADICQVEEEQEQQEGGDIIIQQAPEPGHTLNMCQYQYDRAQDSFVDIAGNVHSSSEFEQLMLNTFEGDMMFQHIQ